MSLNEFVSAPASNSHRLIAYDKAEVIQTSAGAALRVTGNAPCLNMQVALMPLIYITCPAYWEIEVVGAMSGPVCLTALKPFDLTIPLQGIIGYEGIAVKGANQSEQIDVEGGCSKDQPFT